jgi:hypothetical protein
MRIGEHHHLHPIILPVAWPTGKITFDYPGRSPSESEARIIRSALEQWLEGLLPRPVPHWGKIAFDDPDLPWKVDEALADGFGR